MPERSRRIVKVAEIELDNIPELAQQKHADYVVVYTDYSRYWIVIVEEVRGRLKSEDTDKTIEVTKLVKQGQLDKYLHVQGHTRRIIVGIIHAKKSDPVVLRDTIPKASKGVPIRLATCTREMYAKLRELGLPLD